MEKYEYELEQYNNLSKSEKRNAQIPVKPERVRLRVSDTTIESLGLIHAKNPRGLLVFRDELSGWIGSFDRYAKGEADMANWMEMYEGRYVSIDRKGGDPPTLDIKRPAVCVFGTIQPSVLYQKLKKEHFESGFVARLLLAYPPASVARWTEADVMPEVRDRYFRLVQHLYDMPCADEPRLMSLSVEAKNEFRRFAHGNADLMERLPEGALRSAYSKMTAIAARFALVLQASDDPGSTEVTKDAMERAVTLTEWFRYEKTRIYQEEELAERALSKEERLIADLPKKFTHKHVMDALGIQKSGAYKVIRKLERAGLIRDVEHGSYEKVSTFSPQDTRTLGHFGHFASSDGAAGSPPALVDPDIIPCPSCGGELPDQADKCPACGIEIGDEEAPF